ncbi:MAG: hypothetical protein GX258_04375 [Clostridiales bacterium]|jgi:hypothetical protein|nr:hypothetical protein [Clostridiales bacterium]
MKKIIGIIISSILMIGLIGCQDKRFNSISEDIPIKHKKSLGVEIIAANNPQSFEGMPITLKPKLKGEYDRELQYHWLLKNDGDIEGFILPEKGPQKEIINSGEPVELGVFAEASWVEGTVIEFKVELQVEDKETSEIIATNEITIQNNEGVYRLIE